MDASWINNPMFKNIDSKKLTVLTELMNNSKGKSMQDLLPLFVSANTKLSSQGMKFTNDETNLIMNMFTSNMSHSEKKKFEQMKKMIESMGGRK